MIKNNSKNTNTVASVDGEYTPLFTKNYNVYINHTDAGGIVYHANHLVFFENCRRDWFGELNLNGYFCRLTMEKSNILSSVKQTCNTKELFC